MTVTPERILSVFATPIVNTQLEDFVAHNDALATHIRACAKATIGVARSNVGGWHSSNDFLSQGHPAVIALRAEIQRAVQTLSKIVARDPEDERHAQFQLEGWANLAKFGQYHSLHSHPNACWSGVYYVTGNPEAPPEYPLSGRLELIDPRPGASLSYADHTVLYGRFLVNPSPGQMVLFPGWLQHVVHPYFGDEERITVAFNASFPEGS